MCISFLVATHFKDIFIISSLSCVADDYLRALPGADIVLVSKTRGVDFFRIMAMPFSKVEAAGTFDANLHVIWNDSTYLRMIDAANLFWDPRTGRRDLWSLLLNHLLRFRNTA